VLFNSIHFLLFFMVVALLYFVVPQKLRWVWLLVSSYYFYMSWNARYALLMATSTAITYVGGRLIARTERHTDAQKAARQKKWWVALSFGSNLAILFFFKYFHFAADNLNVALLAVGIRILRPGFDVLLPVGISFYTFQALSYTMDVYRGETTAERNFGKYALFVSFFPQLVAGPIERSKNLLKQVNQPHTFHFDRVKNGLLLMLWGYFEKLVIADRAAMLVNQVYTHYPEYGRVPIAVATLLFAVQIYCDFCGYSDIAIGAAQVMGFSLMENFRRPYLSRSIGEFWRRWHISLSSWFRDYLYIPLGGSRNGRLKTCRNVLLTFLASGLWHGAGWTFVVWGLLHGFFQIMGGLLKPLRQKLTAFFHIRTDTFSHRLLQCLFTFALVDFCWIIFRAPDIASAFGILRGLFAGSLTAGIHAMGLSAPDSAVLLAGVAVLFAVSLLREKFSLRRALEKQNLWFRWGVVLMAVFTVLIFGVYGPGFNASSFIYFQF
jgi:D-alanyl-lipoteichoic acid acyltransferase DltB (MBOAT superfamily)